MNSFIPEAAVSKTYHVETSVTQANTKPLQPTMVKKSEAVFSVQLKLLDQFSKILHPIDGFFWYLQKNLIYYKLLTATVS